jgi:hypothetical protein
MLQRVLLLVPLVLALPAFAAENLPEGDWATLQGCEHRDPGAGYVEGMLLSAEGVRGSESVCDFLEVWPGGESRWVVLQLCTGEGTTWTHLSALTLTQDGDLILSDEGAEDITLERCPE